MSDAEVHLTINTDEVVHELNEKVFLALTDIGLTAERDVKTACPVDTGRLRNSITYAVGGKEAAISTYKGDRPSKYKSYKNKKDFSEPGTYSGTAPQDKPGQASVYIGTNVEYATDVELGTEKRKPRPFFKPAIIGHVDEYKRIFKEWLGSDV